MHPLLTVLLLAVVLPNVATAAPRGCLATVADGFASCLARGAGKRATARLANDGVRLRRLADLAGGTQAARVVVNGAFAGVWRSTEVNPTLRWADLEFEIPAALTTGQNRLEVELDARASPSPWTAYEYVALSHRH